MSKSTVFRRTLTEYLQQVAIIDPGPLIERLRVTAAGNDLIVPVFGRPFRVKPEGIIAPEGTPAGFSLSVVVCRYLLLCPDVEPTGEAWQAYRDFRDAAPLLTYFRQTVERPIERRFSGRVPALRAAAMRLGGREPEIDVASDCNVCFDPLPRVPALLLFNDADPEFPAQCRLLFEKRAEAFLDMECLAMTGALVAEQLEENDVL